MGATDRPPTTTDEEIFIVLTSEVKTADHLAAQGFADHHQFADRLDAN